MGDTKQGRRTSSRWRRKLIVLACLAVLVAAFLTLLPIGARIAAENYLHSIGMQADIDDVDINLFTGTIGVTGATAQTAAGDGFEIGRAEISIDYWPLLSREIRLSRLSMNDARVDIRRTRDNHLRVGGFTVLPWDTSPDSTGADGSAWGFGVEHVSLDAVTLHYLQVNSGQPDSGSGGKPEVERRITLNTGSARDVDTWAPHDPAQVDLDVSSGDSNVRLHGQFNAFGEGISGELEVAMRDFELDIVAPAAHLAQLAQLSGRLNSDLALTASYGSGDGLAVSSGGQAEWRQPQIATADTRATGEAWAWDGDIDMQLFQPEGAAGRIATDGTLSLGAIDISMGDTFEAQQRDLRWQGQTRLTLAEQPEAWVQGSLSIAAGDLSIPAADLRISEQQFDWQGTARYRSPGAAGMAANDGKLSWDGTLDLDLPEPVRTTDGITTDGTLSLASIDIRVGDTIEARQHDLRWQGQTTVTLANTPEVRVEGSLSAGEGDWPLPAVRISDQQLDWQGTATYRGAGAVRSEGRLTADAPRIAIAGSQLTISADALDFNGLLDLAAERRSDSLPLTLSGDLDTAGLRIIDDALGRYLVASNQASAHNLAIDTPDDIRIESLDAAGLQAFERAAGVPRRENHAAVIRAADARASGLALSNLATLGIDNLNLSNAGAIYARSDAEYNEIGVFFGADDASDDSQDDFNVQVGHLAVGGDSTLSFVDTGIEPVVHIGFSGVRLELDDFDTAARAEPARFVLSSGVGSNGSVSGRGSIQLFGGDGPSATIESLADSVYLPPFSGYTMATLERTIESGNLDARLDLDVNDGELDGLLQVTLYNFALSPSEDENIPEALGVSLNDAIALVRDSNGRIEFSTRILGDVTAPGFSTANLFLQALYAGLESAIFSYFSPLGWIEAAGDAIAGLVSGQEFEPVIFAAGEATVSDAGKAYLAQFAESLAQRPEPRIKLCGFAAPDDADALALFGFGEVDAESRADLKALAAERRSAVADFLMSKGLDASRLTPCEPTIDTDENARPRVTLSF